MNQAIDIHELDARKAKILDNEQKILQTIEKAMTQNQPTINHKIHAMLDTANMIQLINTFGNISDVSVPVLVQLKYDGNASNGEVEVVWRLDDEEKESEANSGKLSIEYGRLNVNEHDEKRNESAPQAVSKKQIEIENRKNGTEKIEIESIGTHLFKIKYYDDTHKVWSPYSNAKTIHIQEISPSIDSTILTGDEKKTLLQFVKQRLGDNKYRFALLLRSSRDGGSKEKFHELCDNKGATLIIVKSKQYNHVFGGYTSVPWKSSGDWQSDESAFLFLLRSSFGHSPKLINLKQSDNAVAHGSYYGAVMGNTAIVLSYNNNQHYSNINPSFIDDISGNALCGGQTYDATNNKNHYFSLDNYEVFSLSRV